MLGVHSAYAAGKRRAAFGTTALFECPATAAFRHAHFDEKLLGYALRAKEASDVIGENFARGIFPNPRGFLKAAVFECDGEVRWVNQPDSGLLTGNIFTDGSALWPLFLELRVAG